MASHTFENIPLTPGVENPVTIWFSTRDPVGVFLSFYHSTSRTFLRSNNSGKLSDHKQNKLLGNHSHHNLDIHNRRMVIRCQFCDRNMDTCNNLPNVDLLGGLF